MVALKDMRILLTGVQGQVGFELSKILPLTGAKLFVSGRRLEAPQLFGQDAVKIDLLDSPSISETLQRIQPHLIINPAAYTAVDKAESERDLAFQANCEALKIMAQAQQQWGGAMIHFSTDYIYNPSHQNLMSEDEAKNPVNVYAASKWEGEQALMQSDIPSLILRTSWVYGIQGQNFVKTMLRLGREREELSVVSDQVGAPTSAVTLAMAVYTLLSRSPEDPLGYLARHRGAYNISDRGQTNWHEFAEVIFKEARRLGAELKVQKVHPIPTAAYKTAAARPLNSRLDLGKLERDLGFYPPLWQDSLGQYLYQSRLSS